MTVASYLAAKKKLADFDRFVREAIGEKPELKTTCELSFSYNRQGSYFANTTRHPELEAAAKKLISDNLAELIGAHRSRLVAEAATARRAALVEIAALVQEDSPK